MLNVAQVLFSTVYMSIYETSTPVLISVTINCEEEDEEEGPVQSYDHRSQDLQ